jgi:general secretion pathway protein D
MHRWGKIVLFVGIAMTVAGCPKGRTDFNQGRKAQDLQDYDAAFEYYQKALKTDPENAEYQIKFNQARFNAGELHVKNGLKLREQGELEGAATEFQKATSTDASSTVAEQELRKTIGMIDDAKRTSSAVSVAPVDKGEQLAQLPPEIKPLSRAPVNLKMSNDAKMIFDTIGKLAGLQLSTIRTFRHGESPST